MAELTPEEKARIEAEERERILARKKIEAEFAAEAETAKAKAKEKNDPAQFDDSLARWNWGAFLIPVLWAPAHGLWLWAVLWIALSWTIIGGLGVAIYLGAKGSELAWRTRPFRDADHFRQVQSRWMYWGIGITILAAVFALVAVGMEGKP